MEFDASRLRKRAKTARDKKLVRQICNVVSWAQDRGLSVCFTKENSYSFGMKINVKRTLSMSSTLFSLLHECGHFLVGDKNDRFALGYLEVGGTSSRKYAPHRIAVLDEELEAWERGRKLARRLGIKLDKRRFEIVKAHHVVTYCRFVLDRDVKLAAYAVN